MTKELTDEEVFGIEPVAEELSDEDVFSPEEELTDEDVLTPLTPIDRFSEASKNASEAEKTFKSSLDEYEKFSSFPLGPEDEPERIRLYAGARNAQRTLGDRVAEMERLRPDYEKEIERQRQEETAAIESLRDNLVTAPLVDSFLEARDKRDAALAELQGQGLEEAQYTEQSQKIIDDYSNFVTESQTKAQKENEEDRGFIRYLLNDSQRVFESGDRRITTAEAIGGVAVGTPEYQNLASLVEDLGPEYADQIISRSSSLKDKARGVVSASMESGILGAPFAIADAVMAGISAVTTGPDQAADKMAELEELRSRANAGDAEAATELERQENKLRNEALNSVIRELPLEERAQIRRDFIAKKQEERLAGLPAERKQAIIDSTQKIMGSNEAALFDPESTASFGAALPDGSIYLTAKGKMDINASIDRLVEDGQVPEARAEFYKGYYNKLEEDRSRALRGAAIETTSFKSWLEDNPEFSDGMATDEGAQKALDAYEESHNTVMANIIDIVPALFEGMYSNIQRGYVGARLAAIAASDLTDEERADKMLDIYIEENAALEQQEPTSFMGGAARITGDFISQAAPMVTLKFLSLFGPTRKISQMLMDPARAYTMAHMGAVYASQGYLDTVNQAIAESGYASIEEIQEKDPKLAEQISKKGQAAMIDAAKISISEQLPIEALVSTIGSKIKSPSGFKRLMEAVAINPAAEITQEIFADTLMQSSQSRYSAQNKDIQMMSLGEIAQMYVGILPVSGAVGIGARMEDRRQERIRELVASLDASSKARQEAADQAKDAAERAAGLAPQSAAVLRAAADSTLEEEANRMAQYMRDYEERAQRIAEISVPESRTIAEAIQDKDAFVYQGMRGAITEENGEVVFREFGTQSKYIVPVSTEQTIGEIEELQWQRKGQKRQREGEVIEPTVVADRPSVVERNPVVTEDEFNAEPDEVEVPEALVEIEKSPILNFLADLFDTGDSRSVQTEKAEYKSGKRKGQTYERETESPVTELSEYYRQATPNQLNQAKRLIDSALRLIDTMDVDEATKDRLAEHFLLLDQDITNYEQNPEYQKYRQERGWQVSAIGQAGAVPATLTETEAAERELEQRVRAETEAIERRKSAEATQRQAAVVPPETPRGTRIKAAAYVAPDGTVYTADSHLNAMQKAASEGKITQAEIAKKQKATSRETPEFGFSTDGDAFITRDQAEVLAKESGQLLTETPETGRLHSNEVALDDFNPNIDAPPYIARAIVNQEPISVETIDSLGVELPKGWKVEGDLYVFQPAGEKEVKPVKRLDAFARIFSYVQDYAEKNPAQAETLRNKVGLVVRKLQDRTIFDFPVNFQDAVITGIQNRLLSAIRRGKDPKTINVDTIVKSSLSDAKKTYPVEYNRLMDSFQAERESGKKLDDVLSGKVSRTRGDLTPAEKKVVEEEKRRTAAIQRRLAERKMAKRIVEDFEQTLNAEERLAFEFIKAIERLNNDPSNKSKRRQADEARQRLEDAVEDYEALVTSIAGRFAELAERVSGQELAPKSPKVKQTANGQKVAAEQQAKNNVLSEVDAEFNKTEDLTDAEKEARAKTEDPKINTVGAWVTTLPKTSPLRRLVEAIIKANPSVANTPIQYVAAINGKYDGFYDPRANRLVMPQAPTQDINLLIGHEVVHAATLDKARFYDNRQFNQLTRDELNVFRELDKIRNEMISNFGKGNARFSEIMGIADAAERAVQAAQAVANKEIGGELYALVNMAEFLANSINNAEFQKALDSVDPNIFRYIWNLIRKLFYSNREPSASVNAIWDSIVAISRTTRVGGADASPAPSFVLPDYGIEGLPIIENKADLSGLIDQAVLDRRMSPDVAVKFKAVLDFIPEEGYRGTQVLFTDFPNKRQRNAMDIGRLLGIFARGIVSQDFDVGPPIIYISTSRFNGDPIKVFLHENAHLIFNTLLTPELVAQAKEIYDSSPISRQAAFIANYTIAGENYDTRFSEWFAESMVDYYERRINEAGIDIEEKKVNFSSFDILVGKLYKKIFDKFSGERKRIDTFFDGLDASLFRAKREVARQAEDQIAPASVAIRSDYVNAVKNGDYFQAKVIEEDAIGRILNVLTPDLLKKEYREVNKTNSTYGHCYAASEALYHMLGGKDAGLVPMTGRDANGVSHRWLRSKDGRIIDATATQYTSIGLNPPYENGKGGGFLPAGKAPAGTPSRRAQTIIDRVDGVSMGDIAPAAIEPEGRRMSPEEYATYLAGLPESVRENIDTSDNFRGYGLYEARQIAAKVQPNSPKFKKISDKYFVIDQDWDYIANVDGVPYGLVKEEDPDDEDLQVWAYGKVASGDFVETVHNVGMEEEVVKEMREDLAESQLEGPAPAAVSPKQDADYLNAVNRGDMETAQRMVDNASKAAGFSLNVYHGTTKAGKEDILNRGVDMMKSHKGYFGQGFYTGTEEDTARQYAEEEEDLGGAILRLAVSDDARLLDLTKSDDWDKYNSLTYNGRKIAQLISSDNFAEIMQSVGVDGLYDRSFGGWIFYRSDIFKSSEVVTRDNKGNIIPLSERFHPTLPDIRFAAIRIPPEEGGNLPPVTRASLEELGVRSDETQIVTTESTYRRILEQIGKRGVSIMDWASGLGHGARLMKRLAKEIGFEAFAYEPFYNASKKGAVQEPDYNGLESVDLIPDNSLDYIINNAVLNVVDQDTRVAILKQMYSKIKAGGTIYLQARGWTGDVSKLLNNPRNIVVGPREIFVTQKQTFQKGFTSEELINFVESQLPDAEVVKTPYGGVGIAVTKPVGIAPAAIAPKISRVSDEYNTSRIGTATQGKVKETTQETNVTIDTVEDEELAKQMADLNLFDVVGGNPISLPQSIASIKDPKKKRDAFINFVVDNLLALYEAFPVELRAAATRWYDGARKIADSIAKESGLTPEQAAGILASFSPMKDWFQNVELGIQFGKIFKNHLKTKVTKAKFAQGYKEVIESASGKTKAEREQAKKNRAILLDKIEGRSIDGLWQEASRNEAKALKIKQTKKLNQEQYQALPEIAKAADLRELAAWAVRVIGTQEYGLQYNVYSPDGDVLRVQTKKGGGTRKLVWQSATFIEKALSIGYDGSLKNISDNLGSEHKIRSFYNNIIAPNNPYGDTTVDTHAVNAGVLFPMGNKGKLVGDAFGDAGVAGGGNSGIYWLFHEAYRRAAAKAKVIDPATGKVVSTGIQPRQMQSITWEAIRGLFPDDMKRQKSFVAEIINVWKNAPNVQSARKKIVSRGIRLPDWASAYTRDGAGATESITRARATTGSKANVARGLRNRVRSGDFGIAPAAIDPNLTPDPDSEDNTSNEAAAISAARAEAKIAQESIIGHSVMADEIPEELREELEATYKNGMTLEDFLNSDGISLNEPYYKYAIALWLDLNGGLMPTTKVKGQEVERLQKGSTESETVRMLTRAYTIYNNASDSVENGKEITYPIGDIVATWFRSGLGEAALRNAIVQFTNLDVNAAIAIAEDTVKQYEIQERIVSGKERARVRMERAIPAFTSRQAAEKERMIRLEQAVGTIDSIAEAIKLAYDVNVNKARVDRATEKKQIQEQLRVAKRIITDVVPRQYLGDQLTALQRATGLDGLKKIVEVAQDALNKSRLDYAVAQARKAFDRASKAVKAGTLTPEAEVILRGFVDQYTKSGMSEKTKTQIQAVLDEYVNDPINALKRLTTTKGGKEVYAIDKYIRRKGELSAIKIDASLGLDALRDIAAIVSSTIHMDKMAKGELAFNKKMKRDEWKKSIMEEIARIKAITKEKEGFGPKLGGFNWTAVFKGARVENILRGLGLESMRKFVYENLALDAYNDELRNRIGLKHKIEEAFKEITGLEVGTKDYDKYSKQLFDIAGLDQNGNRTTIKVRRSELIDMVASLRDANNFKKAVRAGGFVIDRLRGAAAGDTVEITPESYIQIQDAMTEADLNMVSFIVGLYNNELFTLLNDSSIQAYGHGIKKTDGVYYPRNAFEWDRVTETSEDLDYMEYYNSRVDSVGHLKERTDEINARLVAVDFLSRLDYHVTNDSRIAAYLPIVQDINSILKDSEVMRPLEMKVGRDVVFQIREMVRQQTIPLPSLKDGLLNTLVGNAGVGILGFKIHAALQNPVGIPIAMAYYGGNGFKYALQAFWNMRQGFNKKEYVAMEQVLKKYTPYYSERYGDGGFIQEFTSGLASGPSENRWRKNMEDKSMAWLELTDRIGALARYKVAKQVIRDTTDLQEGTEDFDRAVAREWNLMMFRSENTSHGADRTGWFQMAGRNPVFKIFIMFQSAVSKQYSLFAEAVIQAQQGGRKNLQEAAAKMGFVASSVYLSLAISRFFYGILFPRDEEDEVNATEIAGTLLSAPLSIIPVFGNAIQTGVASLFSPENTRKPMQLDLLSSFFFGTLEAVSIGAKAIGQISDEEIDTKTGDPKWWNTSYRALEKAFNLFGIYKGIPIGGLLQSGKFVLRLGETTWDGINGDLPTDEEFQKKLQKVRREMAPEPTTQEYAKIFHAVTENDQKKFNRAVNSLMEKNPKASRATILASIRRRPEFIIVTMVENGSVKIGEHGITRDEYLSKRALRASVEQLTLDMYRESKD
jgi:hypothetical protein